MITQAFGLKIIKPLQANPFNAAIATVITVNTDVTPIYLNDIVVSSDDTENDIEIVSKAASTDFIRGIVVGFVAERSNENRVYRLASTERKVLISEDPLLICEAYVDGVLSDTDINKYINVDSGTGNNSTGVSGVALDFTSLNTGEGQFMITRIKEVVNTASAQYSLIECLTQRHLYMHGVQANENHWDRTGNTLVPHIANSNVDMGTGNISGEDGDFSGNVNIDGKLTVAGLIDPTALIVTPQVGVPTIDNGAMYYDSGTNRFLFRQNGAWVDLGDTSIWERTGSTVTLENAGDTLDYSNKGVTILSVSATQSLLTGDTLTVTDDVMNVAGSGGAVVLTSNPQITVPAGTIRVMIIGTSDVNTLTFQDGNGLQLDNGQLMTLGAGDTLELIWDANQSLFVELGRKDN